MNKRRSGQYYGFVIDDVHNPLSNLRFADDVLLFAQSRADVKKMLANLKEEAAKYGLTMNMSKTKVLTTAAVTSSQSVAILGDTVDVLTKSDSERYLGRRLCLGEYHRTELKNRLNVGWSVFAKFKEVFR